ncbi:MAG: flagellar hook-length control protein FliK [Desulfovibrio sp.]
MQEVTSTETKTSTIFDQMRASVLVDTSSKSRAFSDFLGLMTQSGTQGAPQQSFAAPDAAPPASVPLVESAPVVQTATATTTATASAASAANAASGTAANAANAAASTANTAAETAHAAADVATATVSTAKDTLNAKIRQNASESGASAAKNAPVSREAFEQAKPLLRKAGLSDTEMADLAARVQAGTLTWGQLVQNLGSHMTGAKKAVALSASERTDLQAMFQKLGFASDAASEMVKSAAKGDGLTVLSSVQNKLATLQDDSSLDMDKNQLKTFFKAMNLPAETAAKLTQLLGPESTVADMKNAMAQISQALQDQRAKTTASDTELAKDLGKIMVKDAAKHARDITQTVTKAAGGTSEAQVGFELKTKDANDMSWFDQREKTPEQKAGDKASDDASWRSFTSKVRAEETAPQNAAASSQQSAQAAATAKESSSLEALARAGQNANVQQGKAETAQQAKTLERPAAPKVLEQVTEAMLKDLGQGRKQLTIQLDPENLGKAQVILQVKGKEISAMIQVEDAQTASMLSASMDSLKKTLEDQGLTVQNLEVQTGLASRQDQQAAFNADQHNQAQERQELSRLFSQLRMMRDDFGDMAPDMQNMHMQAILADQGLHIIA